MSPEAKEAIAAAWLTVLFCAFCGFLAAGDRIKINTRQSDAAIRDELLRLTPAGASMPEVYEFVQHRLYRESEVVGGPQEPHRLHGLWADIGHYHERRSFSEGVFLFPTVVHAYWDFDKNNKLRDIQVHRGVMSW